MFCSAQPRVTQTGWNGSNVCVPSWNMAGCMAAKNTERFERVLAEG